VVKRDLSKQMLDRIERAPDDYLKLAAAYLQQRI